MRRLMATIALSIFLGAATVSAAWATAVPGFETQYDAVKVACAPTGTAEACIAAINTLSAAMIAGGVPADAALRSFTELRAEVVAAGGTAEIEAIFEELLPDSGSVGGPVSPV